MVEINDWCELAHNMASSGRRLAENACTAFTSKGGAEVKKILAFTLLARTLSNAKGALILIRANRVVEARTLVRCCLENQFWAIRTNEDDGFSSAMFADEMKHRHTNAQKLLELGVELEEMETKLREWLRNNKDSAGSKTLQPKSVAEKMPGADAYVFYTHLSSDAAHPSVNALSRYIVPTFGEEIEGFVIDPDPDSDEMQETVGLLCLGLLTVLIATNEALDSFLSDNALALLRDRYFELLRSRQQIFPKRT